MIDQKTSNRNYPLPHADNKLREDVVRLNDAFVDIDTDINDLYATTGTLSTDITTLTQNTQNGFLWHADSTGSGAAYEVILNPAPTALNTGLLVHMKAHVQNTGSATLNVNSLGVKAIKKTDGSNLKPGDILSEAVCFLFYDGINFQLINPKVDQDQTELNTSNIMRAFEEIQENHGGSLLMEAGWSDSFSNENEQGADEANSIGYQHDNTNKLYKGTNPGIGLISDKNYDTDSNYIQQEWTNVNQNTSLATFTNGSNQVTLISGTFPANCDNGRIKSSDEIYYDISAGQGTNTLTLYSNFSGTTGASHYVITLTKFDSESIKLNVVDAGVGSDVTPGKTYSAGNANSVYVPSRAFNDLTGNDQACVSMASTDWIKVDAGAGQSMIPIQYTMVCWNGDPNRIQTESAKSWTFEGSNNDSSWDILDTQTNVPMWSVLEKRTYTFDNTTAYRYLRWNVTANHGAPSRLQLTELEIMESAIFNPVNEYVSICDSEIQTNDTSAWSDINNGLVTETLNLQNVYYWLVFDPASGFVDGTEVKIFNLIDNVWRVIAKKNGTVWEYNNDSGNSSTYSGTAATINDMLHAVSQSIATQAGNRMTGTNLAAITDEQWEETGGWSTAVNSIVRGITLYSNNSSQNPSVSQYRLNYDSERGAMDLRSKTYDPGFIPSEGYLWSRIEHTDFDGSGTFYVSRNGGAEWTVAPMIQQGLPLSGDIRIYRGIVDLSVQTPGQDLRCRYQSMQGKDQFLHSWGLQAKS